MYKDLSVYHRKVHKANPVKSLPYICPGKQQLENILERSPKLEKKLMPEFYASPLGEEEHKRLFWDVWFKKGKSFAGSISKGFFKMLRAGMRLSTTEW
jgi:hypothetical protein